MRRWNKMHRYLGLIPLFAVAACSTSTTGDAPTPAVPSIAAPVATPDPGPVPAPAIASPLPPRIIELVDASRNRRIPVALYGAGSRPLPLAVISHGLGAPNTSYSFLAQALVARGFVVAAVQHELKGDPPLAMGENVYPRRFPVWQAGVRNIAHVIKVLRQREVADGEPVVLVGHSNGGDMSMLFARDYPDQVRTVFSLDNRRMPLPQTRHPHICSVRSMDQPADRGVLPSAEDRRRFHIAITSVEGLDHNEMADWGAAGQKRAMADLLIRCLEEKDFPPPAAAFRVAAS